MEQRGRENFRATLVTLEHYLSTPITEDRDKAGIIQAFKFTFEQCWKAIQQHPKAQGVTIASPSAAFTFAMQSGMIATNDEALWQSMISDRNLTPQTFRIELADQVVERIRNQYLAAFSQLSGQL